MKKEVKLLEISTALEDMVEESSRAAENAHEDLMNSLHEYRSLTGSGLMKEIMGYTAGGILCYFALKELIYLSGYIFNKD